MLTRIIAAVLLLPLLLKQCALELKFLRLQQNFLLQLVVFAAAAGCRAGSIGSTAFAVRYDQHDYKH